MSPILTLQKRMVELGRIRLGGEKGDRQPGRKLDHFRFTSASRTLLEAVAERYGGDVVEWTTAPEEGMWQVYTTSNEIHGIFPPVFSEADGSPALPLTQWMEEWSGGSCNRRCDGITEALTGKPCLCQPDVDAKGEDARACKPTTRLSFMLPDLPGLGVWRCESHGWYAAVEFPGTAQVLQAAATEGKFIPMCLRLEKRTVKKPGADHPRRFVVPVLELPGVTVNQLASGDVPLAINAPAPPLPRPALPAGPPPPGDASFDRDAPPAHGSPPPLPEPVPSQDPPVAQEEQTLAQGSAETGGDGPTINGRQVKLLWTTIRGRGVPEDDVRRILREVTGQESTKAIPAGLFDAVLTAVQAVETQSPFQIPDKARK